MKLEILGLDLDKIVIKLKPKLEKRTKQELDVCSNQIVISNALANFVTIFLDLVVLVLLAISIKN